MSYIAAQATETSNHNPAMTVWDASAGNNSHVFVTRESLITGYLRDKNFKAVHTNLLSILLVLTFCNIINYCIKPSIFWDDFHALFHLLPDLYLIIPIWIGLHVLILCLIYPATRSFVASGFTYKPAYIFLMVTALTCMLLVPFSLVLHHDIRLLSCGVLLLEQVRLIMKMISFIIENTRKQEYALGPSSYDDANGYAMQVIGSSEPVTPTVKSMLYFLIAPTLIYRDKYPAAEKRDLKRAAYLVLEMLIHAIALAIMFKFTTAKFRDIGLKPIDITILFDAFFSCCVFSLMIVVGVSYGLWHQYENFWSEILAFGDRQFYGPWWREKDWVRKIRYLNFIVSDFLCEYLHKPLRRAGFSRYTSSYAVIVVSGLVHEYIFCTSFRFFLPMLSMSMTFSILVTQCSNYLLKGKCNSLLFHYFFYVFGSTFISFVYIMEYYSHQNCPLAHDASLIDRLVPRLFHCVSFE